MESSLHLFFVLLLFIVVTFSSANDDFRLLLKKALNQSQVSLQSLHNRWQVDKFPHFLSSAAISHTSWEVHKVKYQKVILDALLSGKQSQYVISFMGSSVTAGHDTPQNQSLVSHTQRLMSPTLSLLNVNLKTRNAAMGNNPCMPYDLCSKTFAGSDADIVHWEQSYNCFDSQYDWLFEQFVRQSLALPKRPVVVFAESSTPNWDKSECSATSSHSARSLSPEENALLSALKSSPLGLASEHASKKVMPHFQHLSSILSSYKTAGIQLFFHAEYQNYKCQGPYVPEWGCCSASWHPSRLGHELRGSHHAYYWLLILQDAIQELLKSTENPEAQLEAVNKHLNSAHKHLPSSPIHPHSLQPPDNLNCLTEYEPRSEPNTDLLSRVVGGSLNTGRWTRNLFEYIMPGDGVGFIREHREKFGHLDRKWLLFGNQASGPLHLSLTVHSPGVAYLCQPPGDWGKLPDGFVNLWDQGAAQVFLTPDSPDLPALLNQGFDWEKERARSRSLSFFNPKPQDTQSVCAVLSDPLPAGVHVLTILPSSDKKIMLGLVAAP